MKGKRYFVLITRGGFLMQLMKLKPQGPYLCRVLPDVYLIL